MSEWQADILEELKIELEIKEESDLAILEVKFRNAIREVKSARGYRSNHTTDFIDADLQNYIGQIKDLTMYDFNLIGGEGQSSHSENGIARNWKSREKCFNGIVRFAEI